MKIIANELIPVYETEKGEPVASGRELHQFLEVATRYNDWAKARIEKYSFNEEEDFITLTENLVSGGKQANHIFKIDIAKELCMVENNEKGGEARKYFIAVEKQFKQQSFPTPSYMIEDPEARAVKWIEEHRERKQIETKNLMLEQQVREFEPKISYLDQILKSKSTVTITQVAKDYGLTGQALNQILHDENIQYKQNKQWLLYRKYQDQGLTKSMTLDVTHTNGETTVKMNTQWTQKGRLFIHELLGKQGIIPYMDREHVKAQ